MAFTVTGRGTTEANYVTSDDVGTAFTPAENDIVVIFVCASSATALSSVTGWSATWSQINIYSSFNHHTHVWAARIGAAAGSDTPTINFASSDSHSTAVVQIAGASSSGTVADAFVQKDIANFQSTYGPTSPMAIPALNAFASATNLALSFGADKNNLTHTAQSTWSVAEQANDATNTFHISVMYKDSEDTTATVEGSSFSYKYVSGAAFEIAEEAGTSLTITEDSAAFGDTINFSASGLGTLTSWTISDGTNTINLTSGSDTQATIPTIGNDVSRVITGTGLTVTVGDGVGTAQDTIDLNPPTGYTSVKLASGFDTSEDSYLFSYGGTPAIEDEFLFVTADVTLDSLGGIEADGDITTTVYGIDATDGFMESFVLTLGPPVAGGGSKRPFLSSDSDTIGGNFIIWN